MASTSKTLTDAELEAILHDPNSYLSEEESDAEVNLFSVSDHDSESVISSDGLEDNALESEDDQDIDKNKFYYGKKQNFKWSKNCKPRTRTRDANIISHLPGIKGIARNMKPGDILKTWNLFV